MHGYAIFSLHVGALVEDGPLLSFFFFFFTWESAGANKAGVDGVYKIRIRSIEKFNGV